MFFIMQEGDVQIKGSLRLPPTWLWFSPVLKTTARGKMLRRLNRSHPEIRTYISASRWEEGISITSRKHGCIAMG